MSIVNRLNLVREREELNKSQFEKKLLKSTGYLNMLVKRNSNPGADVLADFTKAFPHYSLKWLLTGEGEMLKNYSPEEEKHDVTNSQEERTQGLDLKTVRNEIRGDLKIILDGMTENFRVAHKSAKQLHQDHQKILRFIGDLDQVKFIEAARELDHFLKARK